MFDDYKKEVLNSYLEKKKTHQLSDNLEHPTPKNLKKECLSIFSKRYSKKDDDILSLFFDPLNRINDHVLSIEKFDVNKFKPLGNFLNGETKNPREENVKLLAWLIEFESYKDWRRRKEKERSETIDFENGKNGLIEPVVKEQSHQGNSKPQLEDIENPKNKPVTENPESMGTNPIRTHPIAPPLIEGKKTPSRWSSKYMVTGIIIVAIALGGTYFIKENQDQQCMHWTGERYELVACDSKAGTTPIIPADTFKLAHQRKITRPDTLTRNALGKTWYVKIKVDSAEFYTDSGDYPLDTNKRLLPITPYMLNKYVFAKYAAKK